MSPAEFEETFRDEADERGYRVRFLWPDGPELQAIDLTDQVGFTRADIVVLSALSSLLVSEEPMGTLSPELESQLVLLGEPTDLSVVRFVRFDPLPAYRSAGAVAARWQSERDQRRTVVLVDQSLYAELAEAFTAGFTAAGETEAEESDPDRPRELIVERFPAVPDRQTLTEAITRHPRSEDTLLVLLLGRADQTALQTARGSLYRLGLRGVDPRLSDSVLFSVLDDPIVAASATLDAHESDPAWERIVVPSSLRLRDGLNPLEE